MEEPGFWKVSWTGMKGSLDLMDCLPEFRETQLFFKLVAEMTFELELPPWMGVDLNNSFLCYY
jgi:hypothetical protein